MMTGKWKVVVAAVVVLCGAGAVRGYAEELEFLKNNPQLKERLLEWEGQAPEEVKKEIGILRTGSAVEKARAAVRLGEKGEQARGAILALMETFRDTTGVRRDPLTPTSPAKEAAKAVARIGTIAVEPLIEALKDSNWKVREAAAWALGEIKNTRAVEPLIQALKDSDKGVREAAAWALRTITGMEFGEDSDRWMQWWQTEGKNPR